MSKDNGRRIPRAPEGLDTKARRVWRDIQEKYELRADEHRLLEDAVRTVTLVDKLEAALESAPLMVKGAQGQPAANPLLSEIRQQRLLLAGLLKQLKLPDEGTAFGGEVSRSVIARNAARSRWTVAHGHGG